VLKRWESLTNKGFQQINGSEFGSRRPKWPTRKINKEISCFEEFDILSGGAKAGSFLV
jgi:hypothetical protein